MAKLFADINTSSIEEVEDYVGGRKLYDADIYLMKVKGAYLQSSNAAGSKSKSIVLTLGFDGNNEYSESINFLNREGGITYEKDGKKYYMIGYSTLNAISLMSGGNEFKDMDYEDRKLTIWDFEKRANVLKAVQVPVELLGAEVYVALGRRIKNKQKRNPSGGYDLLADTFEENFIDGVYHNPSMRTVAEARKGMDKGLHYKIWLDKNKGQVRNDVKPATTTNGGTSGPPKAGAPKATGVTSDLFSDTED